MGRLVAQSMVARREPEGLGWGWQFEAERDVGQLVDSMKMIMTTVNPQGADVGAREGNSGNLDGAQFTQSSFDGPQAWWVRGISIFKG
jgi:hypothetical protein